MAASRSIIPDNFWKNLTWLSKVIPNRRENFISLMMIFSFLFVSRLISAGGENLEKIVIKKLFNSPLKDAERIFHESFLKAVPEEKIREILETYVSKVGKFR